MATQATNKKQATADKRDFGTVPVPAGKGMRLPRQTRKSPYRNADLPHRFLRLPIVFFLFLPLRRCCSCVWLAGTQEEAAMAYDIAAIEHRGLNAVTNFDVGRYIDWHRRLCRDQQPLGDIIIAPTNPTIDLEEAMANDDDDQFLLPSQVTTPPSTSSALGLLLRSPRLKEVIEGSGAASAMAASTSESSAAGSPPSWSSSLCSPSPPSPQQQQTQQPEYGASSVARCSFPDDVQTYFGCEDGDGGVAGCAEVDTFLFGDLSAYAAPMFQFELLDV